MIFCYLGEFCRRVTIAACFLYAALLDPEVKGITVTFLRNGGVFMLDHTVLRQRRQHSSYSVTIKYILKWLRYEYFQLQPIDSKREEFRKYLERAGVMDALTKVLVSLYEQAEKPDDALQYPFLAYILMHFCSIQLLHCI
jgi:hypothetical protein